MKVAIAVIFLISFATVRAFPSPAKTDIQEEVEILPFDGPVLPVVDTGVVGGPFFNPFDGLFQSLEGIMTRIRDQMNHLLRGVPSNTSEEVSPFPGFHFPQIDLGKGNTTSVTKVIDGHKVVINETEYKQEGDLGGAFFKVRIIDVKPDGSDASSENTPEEVTRDRELVESSFENEIPKSKEIEEITDVDSPYAFLKSGKKSELESFEIFEGLNPEWDKIERFDNSFEDNEIENKPIDLSRDTYVNDILMNNGATTNPDAEIVDVAYLPRVRVDKVINPR